MPAGCQGSIAADRRSRVEVSGMATRDPANSTKAVHFQGLSRSGGR